MQEELFDLTGGTISRVWRLQEGISRRWGINIEPSGLDDVSITLRETTDCAAPHAVCDVAGRMLPGELKSTIIGPPTLSISDAEVEETSGATLVFTVTLNRPLFTEVTVSYATSDGTASAGSDYAGISGILTFTPETTTQTVSVSVTTDQDDSEVSETLTLTLSDPSPALLRLAIATATGTIH